MPRKPNPVLSFLKSLCICFASLPSLDKNKNANALPNLAKSFKFWTKNLKHFAPTPTQKQANIFIFIPKQSNIIEVMVQELRQTLPATQVQHLTLIAITAIM